MATTRAATVQKYNKLLRRSKVDHFTDDLSKLLMGVTRSTLDFFAIDVEADEIEMPDGDEVKTFIKQSLPPSVHLFGEGFFKMPMMPMSLMMEVADLYGAGTVDAPFVKAIHLETSEAVSPAVKAIVWLTWLTCDSAAFTRSFIDQFKMATDIVTARARADSRGNQTRQTHADEDAPDPQDQTPEEDGPPQGQVQQPRGDIPAPQAPQAPTPPPPLQPQPPPPPNMPPPNALSPPAQFPSQHPPALLPELPGSFPNQAGISGYAGINVQHGQGRINVSIPQGTGPANHSPFQGTHTSGHAAPPDGRTHNPHGHHQQPQDDDRSDYRKVSGISGLFNKENRFTGDLKQSIHVTLQTYEMTAHHYKLTPDQKVNFFVYALGGPAKLFFLRTAKLGDTYERIREFMLAEYNSDARQLQVEGQLQQLRLRHLMAEENIADVSKGLSALVVKIEELTPQCHPEFQTDRHKIRYLADAVAEFSEWSLGPIENINSLQYTFTRFVTALHESIQAKARVKMLQGESGASGRMAHTHVAEYTRNPRHLRRDRNQSGRKFSKKTGSGTLSFDEARRLGVCRRCGETWTPNHRCRPGAIRNHARKRIENGESAVHIVACLTEELEHDNCSSDDDPNDTHHALDVSDAVKEFDCYIARDEGTSGDEGADSVDEAIATQHIISATCPRNNDFDVLEDFQQGDQEQDLSLVAPKN